MAFYNQKNKGVAPRQTKFSTSSQVQEEQRMGGMGPEDNHSSAGFNGEVQLTMYIPAEMSGKVIGVKGIIISNITRETQCRFIKAMQPVGDSLWCAIVIMGEPDRCLIAYQAIAKMVFHEVDDVVLTFYFNRKKHSFLTDLSGFHVIKRISAETQVRSKPLGLTATPAPFDIHMQHVNFTLKLTHPSVPTNAPSPPTY